MSNLFANEIQWISHYAKILTKKSVEKWEFRSKLWQLSFNYYQVSLIFVDQNQIISYFSWLYWEYIENKWFVFSNYIAFWVYWVACLECQYSTYFNEYNWVLLKFISKEIFAFGFLLFRAQNKVFFPPLRCPPFDTCYRVQEFHHSSEIIIKKLYWFM